MMLREDYSFQIHIPCDTLPQVRDSQQAFETTRGKDVPQQHRRQMRTKTKYGWQPRGLILSESCQTYSWQDIGYNCTRRRKNIPFPTRYGQAGRATHYDTFLGTPVTWNSACVWCRVNALQKRKSLHSLVLSTSLGGSTTQMQFKSVQAEENIGVTPSEAWGMLPRAPIPAYSRRPLVGTLKAISTFKHKGFKHFNYFSLLSPQLFAFLPPADRLAGLCRGAEEADVLAAWLPRERFPWQHPSREARWISGYYPDIPYFTYLDGRTGYRVPKSNHLQQKEQG